MTTKENAVTAESSVEVLPISQPQTARAFVGVDDGHYGVKIYWVDPVDNVAHKINVPTKVKQNEIFAFESAAQVNGVPKSAIYEINGMPISISAQINEPDDVRNHGFLASNANVSLVHHALRCAGLRGRDVVIASGLPVSFYYRASGEVNEKLIAQKSDSLLQSNGNIRLYKAEAGNEQFAHISAAHTVVESFAIVFDLLMDDEGNPIAELDGLEDTRIAIYDVGGKTTDICVVAIDDEGMVSIDVRRSGSIEIGCLKLLEMVTMKLCNRFELRSKSELSLKEVERAIATKLFRWNGQEHDVAALVDECCDLISSQIFTAAQNQIGDGAMFQRIYFAGGGAITLGDALVKRYSANISRVIDEPEFANARGFYKIARFIKS